MESLPTEAPIRTTPCSNAHCSTCLNSSRGQPIASAVITDPNSTLSSSQQVQYFSCWLPYPQFTGVSTEPRLIANSIYHGLQLAPRKRYSNGLQFLATYIWSKSIDDSSQADDNMTWLGSFDSLQDPNKP